MIYKIGNFDNLNYIRNLIGKKVYSKVNNIITILNNEYGENRNCEKDDGGFVIITDNEKEFNETCERYNLSVENCEEVSYFRDGNTQYVDLLFLVNDEFSIDLISNFSAIPKDLRKKLIEESTIKIN